MPSGFTQMHCSTGKCVTLRNLSEPEFVATLQAHLSPSSPVREMHLLKGRAPQVDQIKKAFLSVGRHVFIFGDRGVGKSSLALAVGYWLSGESAAPVQVACNGQTFFQVIRDIGNQLLNIDPFGPASSQKTKVGFNRFGLSAEMETALIQRSVPALQTLNEAVSVIDFASRRFPIEPVIIIDEFDQLATSADRKSFADFIKQLGDRQIPAKFFFTGIGNSLDEMLEGHESSYRYLATVPLKPLDWNGRLEIVNEAAAALNVSVDGASAYRIGACSDGFPHYVHLVCEKLFWRIYEDPREIIESQPDHYIGAIHDAIGDIGASLKSNYEQATLKYKDDYQEVLWSVADHHEFKRPSADIYQSYLEIMRQRPQPPLSRARFNSRMNSLKQPSHGSILVGSRTGWYELREPIMRGFIRLKAESAGVELARDHPRETGRREHRRFSVV